MLSYAKSGTAKTGDRLKAFKNGKPGRPGRLKDLILSPTQQRHFVHWISA